MFFPGLSQNRENALPPFSEKFLVRFWLRVKVENHNQCWIWTGRRNEDGYGRLRIDNKQFFAHRIAYMINKGFIPVWCGVILHNCDNPPCVNPSHLIAGTIDDNVRDRNTKDRQAKGDMSGRRKLSEVDVLEMKRRYRKRIVTLKSLGIEYGVTLDQVHRALTGKSWSHLK